MKVEKRVALCLAFLLAAILILPAIKNAFATEQTDSSAECMAVIEQSSGRLLYCKNENRKRPMASTTKICTAITVINNCDDLNAVIKVPKKAVGVEGSSIYLRSDEQIKIIDLLYGLMLRSGNDCAEALAITVGGSIEKFADMMNETAREAGAINTHFCNPHGLHDDDHYTTAYDLALITAYAFKSPVFAEIVATKKHVTYNADGSVDRVMFNKNKLLASYDGADGVKTGYTKKAGRCFVGSATRNGMRVISVVLNCGPMFEESAALTDKAFSEYSLVKVADGSLIKRDIPVSDGKQTSVTACGCGEYYYPLKSDEIGLIEINVDTQSSLSAPVEKGLEVGNFTVTLKNQLLFEQKLYTINSVAAPGYLDKLKDVIHGWL